MTRFAHADSSSVDLCDTLSDRQMKMRFRLGVSPGPIALNGPVREVRFKLNRDGTRDGGVHGLFTIRGRTDAPGCRIDQPDFSNTSNLAFRIPTPAYGAGLIEAITDSALKENIRANGALKARMGISGATDAMPYQRLLPTDRYA